MNASKKLSTIFQGASTLTHAYVSGTMSNNEPQLDANMYTVVVKEKLSLLGMVQQFQGLHQGVCQADLSAVRFDLEVLLCDFESCALDYRDLS